MKARIVYNKLTAISSALLVGCAISVSGLSCLEMETDPANIDVTLVGVENSSKRKIITPFKVELDRGSDYKLSVETEKYRSE